MGPFDPSLSVSRGLSRCLSHRLCVVAGAVHAALALLPRRLLPLSPWRRGVGGCLLRCIPVCV